ncbi:hypothetical protein G6F65_014895 [Rhizopus arrhizus]|nr:hypothetical protein G6F65_014895 [Rhizopus arrhizus]
MGGLTTVDADPLRGDWQDGRLQVQDVPLIRVIDELARHHRGYLGCDPALAALNVTAVLPRLDSLQALQLLVRALPIRIEQRWPWWTVMPREPIADVAAPMKLPCPSPRPLAIALCLALTTPCLLPAAAHAQDTKASVRWQIPAGALDQALTAFGQQSGLSIAADARLTRGRHSNGVQATLDADAALAQLLAGTGLTFQRDASGVVLQAAPNAEAGVRQIGTLRVAGQASEGASPWGLADADAVYRDSGSRVHLDRQQLERFRGQSIGDVLAGAVGVHTADVRNGGALDVNIRGLQGQNRVPVIIDGGQQAIDVYRGYAGVQQRSYLDPDLISAVSIEKGPSLAANAASAIGGVVYMETLNVDDILDDGQDWGLRVRGGVADNSIDRTRVFKQVARGSDNRNSLRDPRDWNGSVAFAQRGEDWQLVAAYARRRQGNFFAGSNDAHRYDNQHLSSGGTGMSSQAVGWS